MPEISVIVPVYKAERFLAACIDSILAQTFSDLEILLVDDGSPDGCGAICDAYAAREPRITVLHQENQGQAAARNHAMKIAKGKWICFVDSDDWIHPQMMELLYDAVEKTGASISMCRMLEASDLPEDFEKPRQGKFEVLPMEEAHLVSLFDKGEYPSWVACAKLIRRELIEAYPFRVGRVYEDNEAVCRWVIGGKQLAMTVEALYFYRTNPISTTQSGFSLKKLDYLWALESIIRFYHGLGYAHLTQRFCGLYVEAAAGCHVRARRDLNRPDVARSIEKNVWKLFRKEKFPLTKEQFEQLLDAMHPKLIRLYWPLEASLRTLREQGIIGLAKKVLAQLRKGADQ